MKKALLELRNRRGFTLVLTAFMMTVAIGAGALALDIGRMQYYRTILQAAADAAALSGAKSIMSASSATASADMVTYAQKYSIQGTTVTNYATIPGTWTRTAGFVATAGGDWSTANAARDSVSFTLPSTSFVFGKWLGPKTLHAGADAIVGSVGATTCVRPLGVPYQSLLQQLYDGHKHSTLQSAATYTLADSDITFLKTSTTMTQLKVTDASDSPVNGSFFLLQMGPYAPAGSTAGTAGTPYSPGPDWGGNSTNGGFPSRFAGDCSNSTWTVTLGDWMQGKNGNVNGPMSAAFDQMCGTHITGNNNTFYCTVAVPLRSIKVALWDTQNSSICSPRCFQVKYLGEFVVDHYTTTSGGGNGGDGLFGYFTAVASDGSIASGSGGSVAGTLLKLALVK